MTHELARENLEKAKKELDKCPSKMTWTNWCLGYLEELITNPTDYVLER